jgi:PAS domain S-box-containing protein
MGMPEERRGRWARLTVSPARLTAAALFDLRRRLLPSLQVSWHQSRPPRLQYELSLPLSGRAAEAFFWMTAGQVAVIPVALGLPESLVDVTIQGDSALLDIQLPPSGTLAARTGRLATAAVSLRRSSATLAAREYELARARQDLESLARDFRQIVDSSPHGIMIQSADGRLVYANAAFARSVGLDDAALVAGRRLAELVAIDGIDDRDGGIGGPGLIPQGRDVASTPLSLRGRLLTSDRWGEEVFLEAAGAQPVVFDGQPARLVFCRDITQRRRLEREVVEAGEEERRRVALELHDGLGQLLAALSMQAQTLGLRLRSEAAPGLSSPAGSAAEELTATAQEALGLARSLARGLAPVADFEGGLPFALKRLAGRVEAASGIGVTVEVDLPDDFPGAGEETDLHCYRVAQEALNNAVRHAGASAITVRLQGEPASRRLRFSVTDNGRGLPAAAGGSGASVESGGLGIHAMRYRAASLGGLLTIESGPGGVGTAITLSVPLAGAPVGSPVAPCLAVTAPPSANSVPPGVPS